MFINYFWNLSKHLDTKWYLFMNNSIWQVAQHNGQYGIFQCGKTFDIAFPLHIVQHILRIYLCSSSILLLLLSLHFNQNTENRKEHEIIINKIIKHFSLFVIKIDKIEMWPLIDGLTLNQEKRDDYWTNH